jgi:hypothetical protein
LFGYLFAGWVRALEVDVLGALFSDVWVANLRLVTAWRRGPEGFLYATGLDGYLYGALQHTMAR